MSLYWHSTLIPVRPRFEATPEQVATFLLKCEQAGAFGGPVERTIRDFDGPERRIQTAATTSDFALLGQGLGAWRAQCESKRAGRNPPVRGMTKQFVAIACENHGQVVSMSDLHEESNDPRTVAFFGDPCSERRSVGLFSHPHSLRVMSVPKAGCASFHIEFWFGNMVLPPASMKKLKLVALDYQRAASSSFGVDFVEGCHWG